MNENQLYRVFCYLPLFIVPSIFIVNQQYQPAYDYGQCGKSDNQSHGFEFLI